MLGGVCAGKQRGCGDGAAHRDNRLNWHSLSACGRVQGAAGRGPERHAAELWRAQGDGHPARPLSEDARARLDAEIETMGELFVETVARNRGLSPQAVRNTEAATYLGAAGLNAGLADAV